MNVTILDGGISRELARVGAPLRQPEWSALWLSFTLNDDGPPLFRSGKSVESAVQLAIRAGAAAILFNCSRPEAMNAAIMAAIPLTHEAGLSLRRIAVGVYANGFSKNAEEGGANAGMHAIRRDLGPQEYLEWSMLWADRGLRLSADVAALVRHISRRWRTA